MPEGKMIQIQQGEYPELDGLEAGSQVKFSGTATIEEGGLLIQAMEFETEGMADREMKKMRGEESYATTRSGAGTDGDDF